MIKRFYIPLFFLLCLFQGQAQYWQQAVDYTMDVSLEAETANYSGSQKLVYTNNSLKQYTRSFITCSLMPFSREVKCLFS